MSPRVLAMTSIRGWDHPVGEKENNCLFNDTFSRKAVTLQFSLNIEEESTNVNYTRLAGRQ